MSDTCAVVGGGGTIASVRLPRQLASIAMSDKSASQAAGLSVMASSASISVRKFMRFLRKLIMNNEFDLRNVDSTCCQIGGNYEPVSSVPKFNECPFPVFLFHSAIKTAMTNIFFSQKITHILNGIFEIALLMPVILASQCTPTEARSG